MTLIKNIECNKIYIEALDYLESVYFYGLGDTGKECFVVFGRDFDPDLDDKRIYITREDQIGTVSVASVDVFRDERVIRVAVKGSVLDEIQISNPFTVELAEQIDFQEYEDVPESWSSSSKDLEAAFKLLEKIVRG